MFKKDLENTLKKLNNDEESAAPKLKNIYFITGKRTSNSNEMRDNLSGGWGGIHCMTIEEPNFNIWG